jgi:anti-anti-sigma factor
MNGDALTMRLRASQRGPIVIAAGRLSTSNVETLLRVVAAALRIRGATTLSLHLSKVVYVDVAGVAGLLECQRRARQLGRTFVLAATSPEVLAGIRACAADRLLHCDLPHYRCGTGKNPPPPPSRHQRRLFCAHPPHGRASHSNGPATPRRP